MNECERLGVKVKTPNVNESDLVTTVSEDGIVYLPITSLKGVGSSGSGIVENKPYTNLNDFVERSGCNKSLFVALAAGDALKCLAEDQDVDEEYFLDFWLDLKSKTKTKKLSSTINVNNNSMSLLEMRMLSKKAESSGSDLLSLLDDF
jgi:DNA polymerase III alpha subunit